MRLLNKLLLLLFVPLLMGADSGKLISYPPEKIVGFRGLDTTSKAPLLSDSRATDLNNVKLSAAFDLKKRSGYSVVTGRLDDLDMSSPAITGIFDSFYSDGNSWTLAFVGQKIKYDNSTSWVTVPGGCTSTSGQNNQWQCNMALDNAVCTNDVNPPIKINSTPVCSALGVSSTGVTRAKTSIWYRNYLILANTLESSVEHPTRFRWSNVGTIETWDTQDFVDISTFGGDEITGMVELYGDLYIFLTKSIWKASLVGGDDVFVFIKVVEGIGSIARDSIRNVQLADNRNVVFFLDDRKKVFLFDGVGVTDIGKIIQPTLNGLSESRLPYSVSTFDGDSYYLAATSSGGSTNDVIYEFETNIGEWTKHSDINANAFAQVKDSSSNIKTYFGNYNAFVYWMDDPDQLNDVDGAVGTVDSVGTLSTNTITGGSVILDATLPAGIYTGATIKITSGTGAGQQEVILSGLVTGVILTTAFPISPDSTSVYSIGEIDAQYTAKWYDLGDPNREKSFLGFLFWAAEQSSSQVDISYAIDFGSTISSETKDLSPSADSLWDSALWDTAIWGVTGDKIYTKKVSGFGNFIQPKFENNEIDSTFDIYGYNILATSGDIKQ